MITQKEFNEIIEKHLKIREDGSIYINNSELKEKISVYLSHFANNNTEVSSLNTGGPDKDGLFDGWNIYCPSKPKDKSSK